MSTNVEQFAPAITEKLEYATIDVYLLKHGIISTSEYGSFQQAFQHGSTNSDLVRKLLTKILANPRNFYHALHEHVSDKQNVHASHMELFSMLPKNFVSDLYSVI